MCYWTRFISDGTREGRRNEYRNSWKLKGIIEAYSMVDAIGRQDAVKRGSDRAKTIPLDTTYYHVSRAWYVFDNPTNASVPTKIVDHIQHMFDCKKQSCWSTKPFGASFIIYSIKYATPEAYFRNDAYSSYIRWPGLDHLLSTWYDPERGPFGPDPQAEAQDEAWFTFSKHIKAERTLRFNLNILREHLPEETANRLVKIITIKVRTLCLKYGINFGLIDY